MVNLLDKLEQYRREESKLSWEGTFGEYLELVVANPGVAQLSHARVYEIGVLYTAVAGMLNLMAIIDSAYRASNEGDR